MKTKKEESKAKFLKLNKTTMSNLQGGQVNPIPGIGIVVKCNGGPPSFRTKWFNGDFWSLVLYCKKTKL